MAISVQGFACRTQLTFRLPLVRSCTHKVRHSSSVAAVLLPVASGGISKQEIKLPKTSSGKSNGDSKAPEWKKLSSKDLGIRTSMIGKPTRMVLNGLRKRGTRVYLLH